ncbi:MAG: efflux RND transporter periplasmic adaptor subunit [Gemmatimonadota bacterium]|nr:MAG: efflux RND transporter periplasmic adaptor subunit [Gemmatimonadota bacterium]
MKRALLLFFSLCVLTCATKPQSNTEDQHAHDQEMVAVTMWTDQLELFMEYEEITPGEPSHFIIHLTKLADFKPVLEGRVELEFTSPDEESLRFAEEKPARDGIYLLDVTLPHHDHYHLDLNVQTEKIRETFKVGEIHMQDEDHAFEDENGHTGEDADEHDHHENEEHHEEVQFLKEQQWKTDFATVLSRVEEIRTSVPAVAEVIPQQQRFSEIVSPVDAFVDPKLNRKMVVPGSRVQQGDILITLSPSMGSSNSWTERQLSFQRAEKDFRRAQALMEREAISQREFEGYRQTYFVEKAAIESVLGAYGAEPFVDDNSAQIHMVLRAPIRGFVSGMNIMPGKIVASGEKLLTIIDPSVVWVRADVYEKDYYGIEESSGLEVHIPGQRNTLCLEQEHVTLINRGELMDPHSRTIPVLFEICNEGNTLKIGQILQVNIYTSVSHAAVVVPQTAILDEIGQQSVFVQVEGESFEKRQVGVRGVFKGMAAISEGLEAGERVVSTGAYLLKLASMNTGSIGHGHIH